MSDNLIQKDVMRLECTTNGSNKFYLIKIEISPIIEYRICTAYGKIGSKEIYGEPVFVSNNKTTALNFAFTLEQSKLKKGYKRIASNIIVNNKEIDVLAAADINKNILKTIQTKKENKIKEEMKYNFYSLESIRDLL